MIVLSRSRICVVAVLLVRDMVTVNVVLQFTLGVKSFITNGAAGKRLIGRRWNFLAVLVVNEA